MSRQSIRTGIAAYLGGTYDPVQKLYRPSPITGVGTVLAAFPKRMPEDYFDHGLGTGTASGAVIVVHLERQEEHRLTVPAVLAIKKRYYDVSLHIYHLSKQPHAEDAMTDLDTVLDSLLARMQADPKFGGIDFTNMETAAGVVVEFGEPQTKGERTESYAVVRFQAVEHITA